MLAEVVGGVRVSRDAHFFDDLGADSMAMARFCARVRKRTDLPSVSIKEVYQHPTVRDLATALTPEATPVAPVPPEPAPVPVPVQVDARGPLEGREIRVWSLPYLRLRVVRTLVRGSPMPLFAGSALP